MTRVLRVFIIFFLVPYYLSAQVTPAESSILSYRLIGFSFPAVKNVNKYTIELAAGSYTSEDFFQKNIISSFSADRTRLIAEVPSFGSQYTWRVVYTDSRAVTTKSELHHFSTITNLCVDTSSTRLRVLTPNTTYTGMYVFVDATRTLYDLNGNAIWTIPQINGLPSNAIIPRDMKGSAGNTITFMSNEQAFEMNYNGDLLFKHPEGPIYDSSVRGPAHAKSLFHHEFTRLSNGHYMSLGMEHVIWEVPNAVDSTRVKFKKNLFIDSAGNVRQRVYSGKIVELDQKHNVVWSWVAADYFKTSDLYYRRRPNGLFHIGNTHENAFYFDEKAKTMLISFRNIHRIIKIQYPSGKVLATYGQLYVPGNLEMKNDLFCGQHACRRSMDGYLYLFNNNSCNRLCDQLPTILMMQEPAKPGGQLKKVWEYECTLDSLSAEEQAKIRFETGGSVFELADRAILCCMAGSYNKVFIVNRDKKVLWSALPEQWNQVEKKWKVVPGYRASPLTRKQLENLIWGEQLKK